MAQTTRMAFVVYAPAFRGRPDDRVLAKGLPTLRAAIGVCREYGGECEIRRYDARRPLDHSVRDFVQRFNGGVAVSPRRTI